MIRARRGRSLEPIATKKLLIMLCVCDCCHKGPDARLGMKFNKEKWEATYKAVAKVQAEKGHGPSDGIVCIHASLKYIQDGFADDIGQTSEEDKAFVQTIKDSLKELYQSCADAKTLSGFASNASSAAKACELATTGKASAFADF